jgi:hypothetical protein
MKGMLRVCFLLAAVSVWADTRCVECHQAIVASYNRTGKARSISKPRAEIQPQRQWYHEFSGRRMMVVWQQGKMTHGIEQKGSVESYEVDWAIGSGREAKSYLVRIADSLFQSPLAYYANRIFWDMAPGYVVDSDPHFYRPVQPDCLQCHAGRTAPIAGTQNRFADPPIPEPAISCESCHADATAHLKIPGKGNIVNPARLSQNRRDAVCESCHLSGEARVANPGRQIADYRAGMAMEDVFSIYVSRRSADDTVLPVYSHAEQLASSRCATQSEGRMWCGSCHDSHREIGEKERLVHYRDRCLKCHQGERAETHRRKAGDDCVRCHMPRERSFDGSHAARTNHWIRTGKDETRFLDRGEYLRAWREPPAELRNRNLALAYLLNYEKSRSLKRLRAGLESFNKAVEEGQSDGEMAVAAALQHLRQKSPLKAIPLLEQAVREQPGHSMRRLQLAAALGSAGRTEEAKQQAQEAIRLEPLLEQAYNVMAQLEPARGTFWKDQYRKAAPKRTLP